mgnify:CR=1 FL=1
MTERNFSSFNIKQKRSKRCGTIIFNKTLDKVVAVLNRYSYDIGENKWGFPKGGIHKDETFVQCAERETLEETGLIIEISTKNTSIIKLSNCVYFPIILDEDETVLKPIDTREIYKVSWLPIDKLLKYSKEHTNHEMKLFLRKGKTNRARLLAKNNIVRLL